MLPEFLVWSTGCSILIFMTCRWAAVIRIHAAMTGSGELWHRTAYKPSLIVSCFNPTTCSFGWWLMARADLF
jgi:hypothetical protein